MADTEDLNHLSTSEGNADVNGVKVGEPLTGKADGNAELRLASMKRRYTDLELSNAVENTTSIRQVLARLGLVEGRFFVQIAMRLQAPIEARS
jgi:hypothetical protein